VRRADNITILMCRQSRDLGVFLKPQGQSRSVRGLLYLSGFCYTLSRPQGHSAAGRIMSMRNSNYAVGNRNRELPACNTAPQPIAPSGDPRLKYRNDIKYNSYKYGNVDCMASSMLTAFWLKFIAMLLFIMQPYTDRKLMSMFVVENDKCMWRVLMCPMWEGAVL
jgi:hypothetical protein